MKAAILTTGTELTRGELQDTNANYLASKLTELGFEVIEMVTVDDDQRRTAEVLSRLGRTVELVLCTGGLGPTSDDFTAAAAAEAAGVSLIRDEQAFEILAHKISALGREMTPARAKQADVPVGAEVLGNPAGTAPAFSLMIGSARCYFLPGVPREMKAIVEELVIPKIGPMAYPDTVQVVLRVYGLPEATVGELLSGLEASNPGLILGYRLNFPEVEVKVRVRAKDIASAREQANRIAQVVRDRLGPAVYGQDDDTFATAVGRALRARGYTVAVAESCTGGLVGALLTSVAGSSDYLLLDAVTYSNAAKERVLSVSKEVLLAHGAVSRECAEEMAKGALNVASTDVAVSITGIAGPSGGSEQKPVGTVFFALASASGVRSIERRFDGDRGRIQRAAAFYALQLLRESCDGPLPGPLANHCG